MSFSAEMNETLIAHSIYNSPPLYGRHYFSVWLQKKTVTSSIN